MKRYILILLLICTVKLYGQFAIITDKDGFVNVRQKGQANSTIIDSLPNGHLVFLFENEGNWKNIDYTKKAKDHNGYVYKDRTILISTFLQIPIVSKSPNSVTLKKDSIEVILTQSNFEKSKHKFKYTKENSNQIELIDNKQYWGSDGEMPKTQFEKIVVKIGKREILLPKEALINLYQPSLNSADVYFDKKTNTIYITTFNSDGAGAYEVVWKIENGIYKDKLVAYGF
jgi:hypothetical protein